MEIMNLDSFLIEMDNDYDDVNLIVGELIASIETQIPLMKDLSETGDFSSLKREAHSIKGGARNIMAPRLEVASADLENSAKDCNYNKSVEKIAILESEFRFFKNFIAENLFINH